MASVVVGAACEALGRAKDTAGGLISTQQAVQRRVGVPVRINIQNVTSLTVSVTNSPLHSLPAAPKKAKALELAKVAYDAYPERAALTRVQIVFVVQISFLIFHYTDARDAHVFEAGVLRSAPAPPATN